MNLFYRSKNGLKASFLVIISITFLGLGSTFNANTAYARVKSNHYIPATCSNTAQPTTPSVLVVLLDRSGSIDTTDQYQYSTSVTKALADLWPGTVIVIPFGDPLLNDPHSSFPVLPAYKAYPSESSGHDILKQQIQQYPIKGGTPLAPAMNKALGLPELQHPSLGSKAIIITDGGPTPTASFPNATASQQKMEIESTLIGQFNQQCIPISAFGLQTDTNADSLLSEIAGKTGGVYKKVQTSGELALQVMTLYSQWRGLSFQSESLDLTDQTYHVDLSELTQRADIVTFHANNDTINVTGPGNLPIQPIPTTDKHYEITGIDSAQITPGTYRISLGGDPTAQVYVLLDSKLQVGINTPSATTTIYAGQRIKIAASLLNGPKDHFTPTLQAGINAFVTFTPVGQAAITTEVPLVQQSDGDKDTFIGFYTLPPKQLGQVQIDVKASYNNTDRESQPIIVQLACSDGFLQCFWEEHHAQILDIGIPILFLLLFLIILLIWFMRWSGQPAPYGWLVDTGKMHAIELGKDRPLLAKLFSKSVIDTREVEKHPDAIGIFDFAGESCQFVYKPGGVYLRRVGKGFTDVSIKNGAKEVKLSNKMPEAELQQGSAIKVGDTLVGIFQTIAPQTRGNLRFTF